MTATLETLVGLDERLAAQGRPLVFASGSWWRAEAERVYGHPTAREWAAQVGRGGAKSTVLYRVAINETLFGDFIVPPGERHYAVIKSRSKEEAGKALGIISHELTLLGVRFELAGDVIELSDAPRGIRIVAASVAATSGWRVFFDGNDEVAKWPTDGATAVDAAEVISSGRAMTVTHPTARRFYFSSPFGVVGPHYDMIARGDTATTIVSCAPSWIANPAAITEARTHELEPNERIWRREYAAIPQSDVTSVFDVTTIDRAMRPREAANIIRVDHEWVLAIDASRGGDAWTYLFGRWTVEEVEITEANCGLAPSGLPWVLAVPPREYAVRDPFGRRLGTRLERQDRAGNWYPFTPPREAAPRQVLQVAEVGEIPEAEMVDTERAVNFLARKAQHRYRARLTFCDQYEYSSLSVLLKRAGLRPYEQTWTATTKSRAVDRLERMLRDNQIRLPASDILRRQLLEYSEKITRSGAITYSGRGRHDDYAQVLVTLAMASVSGQLPGDPFGMDRRRHELSA